MTAARGDELRLKGCRRPHRRRRRRAPPPWRPMFTPARGRKVGDAAAWPADAVPAEDDAKEGTAEGTTGGTPS